MLAELMSIPLPPPLPGKPRTPGIHASRVIRNLAVRQGRLRGIPAEELGLVETGNETGFWEKLPGTARLKVAMGLAWEDYYGPVLREVTYHPGEMELDGVYMTPDGESVDFITVEDHLQLHEFKVTWKSARKPLEKGIHEEWMWVCQCKAYCKGAGTLVCYLHVFFVCGDHSYPINPMLLIWRLEFTQTEVDESWDEILEEIELHRSRGLLEGLGC